MVSTRKNMHQDRQPWHGGLRDAERIYIFSNTIICAPCPICADHTAIGGASSLADNFQEMACLLRDMLGSCRYPKVHQGINEEVHLITTCSTGPVSSTHAWYPLQRSPGWPHAFQAVRDSLNQSHAVQLSKATIEIFAFALS